MRAKRQPQRGLGYVSYARHDQDVAEVVRAAETGELVTWTVHPDAERGDVVVFYCVLPKGEFFAHGLVETRHPVLFERRKPQAKVGSIQLLRDPVKLREAKSKLPDLRWLWCAQAFEKRVCWGVDQIITLGDGSTEKPASRATPSRAGHTKGTKP